MGFLSCRGTSASTPPQSNAVRVRGLERSLLDDAASSCTPGCSTDMLNPAAMPFLPAAVLTLTGEEPAARSSSGNADAGVITQELRRSTWKTSKRRTQGTKGRTDSSTARKRQGAKGATTIGKESGELHLKKHLEVLQALPMVRSGLSDLLDSLAVPSSQAIVPPPSLATTRG